MAKRIGKNTVLFEKQIAFRSFASIVGKKEGQGPLGNEFDLVGKDDKFGQKSFERAESQLQRLALLGAVKKAGYKPQDIDCIFAGDLLNQCIGSSFGIKDLYIPFVGLYGACSTMALSIINASMYLESGAVSRAVAVTSSHFCSAERQYRFPLEYGAVRPQTSQWTVTGSGAVLLECVSGYPYIHSAGVGVIQDLGIKDTNNMGAAMAPAAYETIKTYLIDTNTKPSDYDVIFTGDLGYVGSELLYRLFERDGMNLSAVHSDCGLMIFDRDLQDVHSGGSGCGCGASVLCSRILQQLQGGILKNVLFCATGALLSPTSAMQGENIPSIAHVINIRAFEKD